MKKTITALIVTMILSIAAAAGTLSFGFAAGSNTGGVRVNVRTDGTETQFVAAESSPATGDAPKIISYKDEGEGIGSDGAMIRLFDANAYAVYEFDLEDSAKTAYFNVVGGSFEVSYKTDADSGYTAFPKQAAAMKYGIASYKLDESNALRSADNSFKIKLTNREAGQICLFMVTVSTEEEILRETLSYAGNSLDSTPYVVSSDGAGAYFGGAADRGMFYLKPEKSVTFAFHFDTKEWAKAAFDAAFGLNGNALGNSPAIGYSEDGTTFSPYTSGASVAAENGCLYFKITNGAGAADLIVENLSVRGLAPTIAQGENGNAAIPENENESFFKVGTAEEAKHIFGVGEKFQEAFESTHGGMVVDGHQGGSAIKTPNARKMTAGQYVAYDFDFADVVKSGSLKLYAQAGVKAMVSADGGTTYTELAAKGTPTERGLYIFALTEKDAFQKDDNAFRLVLQASGETYLFAVCAMSDEASATAATEGVSLKPLSEDSFRYLVETAAMATYYTQGVEEGRGYFFHSTDSVAVFKVPFSAETASTVFYVNQCANVKIELSGDGKSYTKIVDNLLSGTGDVPYNTFDATSYLGEDHTIWLKVSGNAGGGFVFDMGFSGTPKDEKTGAVDMDNFGKYLVSVSNSNEKIGQLQRIAGAGLGADKLVWKLMGDAVFKLDLNDDAVGVKLTVKGIADVTASVYVSSDNQNWSMVGTADNSERTYLNYGACKKNDAKVVYVKFSSSEYYFDSFAFTTEGIEAEGDKSKPYDDADVDFNYDQPVPGADSYDKTVLPAPEIPEGEVVSGGGCGGSLYAGGAALAAAILAAAAAFLLCKKNRSSRS